MNPFRRFRRKDLKKKTKELKEKVTEHLSLFNKLPSVCSSCGLTFDRTNRLQVSTWTVEVWEEEKKVRLYCPRCVSEKEQQKNKRFMATSDSSDKKLA